MTNFPVKAINPEINKEETFWISRSVAVAAFIFGMNSEHQWCVLANKRGPGCPDNIGKWVCPCGYLDWGETINEATSRETFEETGIKIDPWNFTMVMVDSSPKANHQNVTIINTCNIPYPIEFYQLTNENSEPDEVDEIKWIPFSDIDKYDWAFGHKELITMCWYC